MAQVFPLNVDDLSADEARVSLAGTLAALPDPWTLLRQRRIGGDGAEPVEVVLVHPEIGVALVEEAPRDPTPSAHRLYEYLDGQRFGEFFPGELPIVALSVAAEEFEMLGERLAAAFEAAPRLSIDDADWADAVIELLMVPDDLAMAPVGDAEAPRMPQHATSRAEGFDGPEHEHFVEARDERVDEMSDEPVLHHESFDETPRERFDELSREPVLRERFDDPPRERYSHAPSLDGDEPPLPLMVDWPFAASYQRRRRRARIAALAVILLLLAGAGVAAWEYAGDDLSVAINDVRPRAQDNASRSIEIPLPSQSSGDQSAQTAAKPAPAPPPVPAAPPVVMAQKPYAPPPPSPPKATPVEPLPQVAEAKPPSPPPVTAPPSAASSPPAAKLEDLAKATAPPRQKEPEKTQTASAPPPPPPETPATETAEAPSPPPAKPAMAASPAKPKPTRTAKAEPPPRRAEPTRHEPSQASRPHPSEPSDNPPIDAADLPPLDKAPAPQRPTQLAAPSGSSQPAGGLGPPVPLWRSQQANSNRPPPPPQQAAATPASVDAGNRECRPYTSSTTLTGRGLRVEGIACRGNDGQWRLVSEVPLR